MQVGVWEADEKMMSNIASDGTLMTDLHTLQRPLLKNLIYYSRKYLAILIPLVKAGCTLRIPEIGKGQPVSSCGSPPGDSRHFQWHI